MSFGGFGSGNNNKFGFGATSTGFGSSTNNANATGTGFGGGSTGTGLFGGGANTSGGSTFGGFGSSTFGAQNNNNANTTGGSLFGGGNANPSQPTGGFGGFGANTSSTPAFGSNNASTTPAFGASNTGSSLFGGTQTQNKPAFGAQTGGGLFGSGPTSNTTGAGFGASNAVATGFGAFGSGATTGFDQQPPPQNQGTAVTPFDPFSDKDQTSSGNNIYQTITCQPPYQKFSLEELRLADYNAGRRYGNSNGQAGAFGQSTGFGGFGQSTTNATPGFGANNTTGGGLFGNTQNNTSSPFGGNAQTNNATPGFGTGTAGGLFGTQNTSAGGGLFGNNNSVAAPAPSGGLFGTPNTTGAFGSSSNTGGGLFGNQTNQDQAKPFGGFGTTNTVTSSAPAFGTATTTGFGQQNNTPGGSNIFGNNSNTNNTQTQQPASGGLFGNTAQNMPSTQNQTIGGSLFGGFGQNQQAQNQPKPGGLFGATNTTGGGLFGNNAQQQSQPSGSLFGNNNNPQASGGLFGNNKPAGSTPSLFGNNAGTQGGSSLFGQTQAQPQQPSLFGQQNNQNQNKPSLFGNTTGASTGSSLFGGSLNQNNNQPAFGTSQQTQPLGGSLFGNSQQQSQPQSQQQSLTASMAHNPYGNDQLFANLGTPSPSVGPLATPLSGAQKPAKRSSIIPAFKINSNASMRLITPQKQSGSTYGLNYMTYGTPGSAQSFGTGRGNSLLGSGGLGRPLSKSLSTSNLKTSLSTEDSVLAPGAFTANHRPYSSTHSIRKLKIDRSLRTDLFGDGESERQTKRVSFDSPSTNGAVHGQSNGDKQDSSSRALVRAENEPSEPSSEELGLLRAQRSTPNDSRNGTRTDKSPARNNELAIVPEDEQTPATEPRPTTRGRVQKPQTDQEAGVYYMIPSLQELRDMSRDSLKNMSPFIVGRVGVARIEFSKVDLTTVPLDEILGGIVKLNVRSATVYESGATTPPQGKGLNVPSKITLENSWPRSNGGLLAVQERKGPRFDKHIERLKRVGSTEFISYDSDSGEWTFSVQHFTTYGLEYADDVDETAREKSDFFGGHDQAMTLHKEGSDCHDDVSMSIQDSSLMSPESDRTDVDDTFDFKKGPSKNIPGGFGDQSDYDVEYGPDSSSHLADPRVSQQSNHTHAVEPHPEDLRPMSERNETMMSPPATVYGDEHEDDQDMAGTYPAIEAPAPILKAPDTPPRNDFDLNDDWAAQLQRTVSPRKHDRQTLRELQETALEHQPNNAASFKGSMAGQPFETPLDIMNSLWSQPKSVLLNGKRSMTSAQGFKWPDQNRQRADYDDPDSADADHAFHESIKPRWTTDGTLMYGIAGNAPHLNDDTMTTVKKPIISEGKDIRFAAFVPAQDTFTATLKYQLSKTKTLARHHDAPTAQPTSEISFADLGDKVLGRSDQELQERHVWKLASILFDPLDVSCAQFSKGVPAHQVKGLEHHIRRDAALKLWTEITSPSAAAHANECSSHEERALAHLSAGDLEGACMALVDGKNYHLATIVSQFPADDRTKQVMRTQVESWRDQNVLSEMSKPIRALYALASGQTCIVEGRSGAAEDRAQSFGLAEYLGLDWRRALGLRFFFGSNDLVTAIQQYSNDVAQGKEKIKPTAPPTESRVSGDETQDCEDTLMGLFRLYAHKHATSKDSSAFLLTTLNPSSVSGSPLNARLAWQLATILKANKIVSATEVQDSLVDSLSQTLAFQLESTDRLVDSCYVLLHLSSSEARKHLIRDLLDRKAALLVVPAGEKEMDKISIPAQLTEILKLPAEWIWTAKALHAAYRRDYESQISYTLQAGDKDGAHSILCRTLGPRAIVSKDHDSLREVLGTFLDPTATKEHLPDNWRTGGQVYFDYIHLLDLAGQRGSEPQVRKDKIALLKRLGQAMPAVMSGLNNSGGRKASQASDGSRVKATDRSGLEERVAVSEMARNVRSEVMALGKDDEVLDQKSLARLPVPDDSYAKQGVRLAGLYYRAIGVQ